MKVSPIKALSEYLGHADPGFTLRTYPHLVEDSAERTKRAVDAVFSHRTPVPDQGAMQHRTTKIPWMTLTPRGRRRWRLSTHGRRHDQRHRPELGGSKFGETSQWQTVAGVDQGFAAESSGLAHLMGTSCFTPRGDPTLVA